MKHIGIISRCDKEEVLALVNEILVHLRSRVDVLLDPKTAQKLHLKGT
jgi:hypothetical protein